MRVVMAREKDHRTATGFPLTRWSLVARACEPLEPDAVGALDELLRLYCPFLKQHLVRQMNFTPHGADDFIQNFVTQKIMERNALASADPARGRFRVFLLKTFKNFVISEIRRGQAQKRAPLQDQAVSLDETPDLAAVAAPFHQALDQEWARQVLALAVDRMRKECAQKCRPDLWEVFSCRVLEPALEQAPLPSYDELVRRFGFQSPSQASNLLITAKRMFRRALEDTVRDTVADESQIEEEIRDLKAILAT
jgi:RNA polymerase sigma-70 factor (ECF subfamily)